jgi:TolB protein
MPKFPARLFLSTAALVLFGCQAPPPADELPPGRLLPAKQARVSAPCRTSSDLRCIAVLPLADEIPAINAATIIGDDLVGSERFAVLRREDLRPAADGEDYAGWQAAGADTVAVVGVSAARSLKLTLYDVRGRRPLLTQELPLGKTVTPRTIAHLASDLVFERLTGRRGVAATSIAYVDRIADRAKPMFRLLTSDADGGNLTVVAESREPMLSPTWSTDASQLAWMGYDRGPSSIFVKDLRSGAVRKLVAEATAATAPAFSPDGRELAFSLNGRGGSDIYIVDLASGSRRQLTQAPGIDTEPSWSPDGRTIAFTSDRGGQPQIYSVPASGGAAQLLSRGPKQSLRPCYAPDGRSLALVALERGRFRVGVLDLASGRVRLLGDGPGDEAPSFAPNGATLIYTAQAADHGELMALDLERGRHRRLRPDADVRGAAWSPYRFRHVPLNAK